MNGLAGQQFQHRACIALGSNLGDRPSTFNRALDALSSRRDLNIAKVSTYYDTAPVGGPLDQPRYLNAAAVVFTSLSPRELLKVLLETEKLLGRDRSSPQRNQPRVIDLDLLLYDDLILNEPGLDLPHPRMHERFFVLLPLSEIAPEWMHPVSKKSVYELLKDLEKTP